MVLFHASFKKLFGETVRPPSKTGVITHGKNVKELPLHKIREPSTQYISAYCAPEDALNHVHDKLCKARPNKKPPIHIIKGVKSWSKRKPFAYGTTNSLYESDTDTNKQTGDPVADSLAIVTRSNCSILALADGVNWGIKSKLAANCCIYGAITYIDKHLRNCRNTREVLTIILRGFNNAQNLIIDLEGTMSTLCVGVVVELQEKDRWAFCVVNVGDSYAYVYNKEGGIQEVTENSHPIDEIRDMRFSGGSLGLADGCNPDLKNLTCSCVLLERKDIVFICSDGISDNFDPKVMRSLPRLRDIYQTKLKPKIESDSSTENTDDDKYFRPVSNSGCDLCDTSEEIIRTINLRHIDGSVISSNDSAENSSAEENDNLLENEKISGVVTYCRENNSVTSSSIHIVNQSNSDSAFSNSSSLSPENHLNKLENTFQRNNFSRNLSNSTYSSSNESLTNNIDNLGEKTRVYTNIKVNPRVESLKCPRESNPFKDKSNLVKYALERSLSSHSTTRRKSIEDENKSNLKTQNLLYNSCPDLSTQGTVNYSSLSGRLRHYGALQNIEEALIDEEAPFINENNEIQADEICTRLLTKVFRLTKQRREILEEIPQNQVNKLSVKERRKHNEDLKRRLEDVPGKLDHVSVVAFSIDGLLNEVAEARTRETIDVDPPSPPLEKEEKTSFFKNLRRRISEPSPNVHRNIEMSENRDKALAIMR